MALLVDGHGELDGPWSAHGPEDVQLGGVSRPGLRLAWESGVETDVCNETEGGMNVTDIHEGNYTKVREVEFGSMVASFEESRAADDTTPDGGSSCRSDVRRPGSGALVDWALLGGLVLGSSRRSRGGGRIAPQDVSARCRGRFSRVPWLLGSFLLAVGLAGCSDESGDQGESGTGGDLATGGAATGAVPTGGTPTSGGSTLTGGMPTGGVATGGLPTGGVATGGLATGGSTLTGGMPTGGTPPAGGVGTGGITSGGSGGTGAVAGGNTGGGAATGGAATGGDGTGGGAPEILGATPPMGWNSWNTFACDGLNESVVRGTADAFVSTGMAAAGYEYVNLDDCWMDGRDPGTGRLRWDTTRFPSGIPALAEYIHGLGLKIGIYTTPNNLTCTGLYGNVPQCVGSLGHEETDAQTFAEWGIDYLKYDLCAGSMESFLVMRDALRATGRPIFYSINPANQGPFCTPTNCATAPPGLDFNLPEVANMWRIEMDIWDSWREILRLIDANKNEYAGAGPGHWNDPDMLEVGNPGLSDIESRAHFSMWAIMAAPLIAGNDVTNMSATTIETLTNAEVIAVDQDPLGYQGRVVATPGADLEVWSKDLAAPSTRAVALFNRGSGNASITVQWSDIGLGSGAATVRDLWAGQDLGSFTDSYTANDVPGHGVVMLKITSTP